MTTLVAVGTICTVWLLAGLVVGVVFGHIARTMGEDVDHYPDRDDLDRVALALLAPPEIVLDTPVVEADTLTTGKNIVQRRGA